MTRFSVTITRLCTTNEEKLNGYNIIDLGEYGKLHVEYVYFSKIEGYWYPTPKAIAESKDPYIRYSNIGDAPFYVSIRYYPKDNDVHYEIMNLLGVHICDVLRNVKLRLDTLRLAE